MSILRREPWGELVSLRDEMDRLFAESLVRPFGAFEARGGGMPEIDILETDAAIVVKAATPGVKPEDLEITTVGDTVTIKGQASEEKESEEEGKVIYRERRQGAFCRSFTLPTAVQADQATAEFEHGVLTLTLPKAEESRPKAIKIKHKK